MIMEQQSTRLLNIRAESSSGKYILYTKGRIQQHVSERVMITENSEKERNCLWKCAASARALCVCVDESQSV